MSSYPVKIGCSNKSCGNQIQFTVNSEECGSSKFIRCKKCNTIITAKIPEETTLIKIMGKKPPTPPSENGGGIGGTYVGGSFLEERMINLEVIPNQNTGFQTFIIDQEFVSVGRKNSSGPNFKPDIEILTDDKFIGRVHCAIQKKANKKFVIKDLESKNKTYLNGQALEPGEEIYLNDGDEIKIGRTSLKVTFIQSENSHKKNNHSNNAKSDDTYYDI